MQRRWLLIGRPQPKLTFLALIPWQLFEFDSRPTPIPRIEVVTSAPATLTNSH
ncbi:hypothetical protein J6590_046305 [Homalodisca vitripennis]|nr:hypothetical protein J6590_046305 [Homalodisca vitripennis]